jgi:hypothetical protein
LLKLRSGALVNARGASAFYEVLMPQVLGADFSTKADDPASQIR